MESSTPLVPPPTTTTDAIAGIPGSLGGTITPLTTAISSTTPSSPSTSQTTTPSKTVVSSNPATIPTVGTGGTNSTTTSNPGGTPTNTITTPSVAPGAVDSKTKEWVPTMDNIRTLVGIEIGKAMALTSSSANAKYSVKDTQSNDILTRILDNVKSKLGTDSPSGKVTQDSPSSCPMTPALLQGVEFGTEVKQPEPSCDPSQYIRKDQIPCYQCQPN